ncbi:Multi-copper polyphenol oxidoreductase, laccase [Candidatus Terasakiella magnetica]|uniref:Purine nucleoside phosphorylase n=1 Tax=Candidatus Terasakiella magnetica TaxID=1867952 RepID=A0A1C3RIE8_9PROT|nr:peptidoglycan editing factor PgeF [Candidatus Terasakiella magnetica]SCA57042.1 Multi-copper polyphenol oxidoreductase, laccase [Candidatus Terasakiella magnetica]
MSQDATFLTSDTITTSHGFFTRLGGISQGIYGSLNCAWGSKDSLTDVMTNRALVVQALGNQASDLLSAAQVHSNRVQIVDKVWTRERSPEVDALVTKMPNVALGILTADCAPVLFHDSTNNIIGAAHAGWKGAFGGVLENTVKAMEEIGADRSFIKAAVGPCIHQASYEVDGNFRQTFLNHDPDYSRYFIESVNEGHFQFDLPAFVKMKLDELGLNGIEGSPVDTYVDAERFFSYRRTTHNNEPDYGRQISVITL